MRKVFDGCFKVLLVLVVQYNLASLLFASPCKLNIDLCDQYLMSLLCIFVYLLFLYGWKWRIMLFTQTRLCVLMKNWCWPCPAVKSQWMNELAWLIHLLNKWMNCWMGQTKFQRASSEDRSRGYSSIKDDDEGHLLYHKGDMLHSRCTKFIFYCTLDK